jgi:PAS domain S-box-containing protein
MLRRIRALVRRLGRRTAPAPESGESFSHLLLENVGDLVAILARDGTISYASPSHERVLGYPPAELVGTNVVTLVHPEDHDAVRRMRQSGEWRQTTVEFRLRHRDGSWRLIEGVARDLRADARVRGVLVTARDVTARRSAETALRESQERYQTLARVSPVGIFHTDAAGAATEVNDRWCEISGRTRTQSLGHGLDHAIHPDDRGRVRAAWRTAVARAGIVHAEYRLQRPDGAVVWVLGEAHPQWDEGGRLRGYVGTVTDISDR